MIPLLFIFQRNFAQSNFSKIATNGINILFCFSSNISRENVLLFSSEEQLVSIAERTIVEADKDGDQMISFQEFCTALERTDVEQKMSIRFLN